MSNLLRLAVFALAIALIAGRAHAQTPAPTPAPAPATVLSFARVFASPGLSGPAPARPELSPDGKLLTVLRNRAEDRDRYDLWALDPANGQWRMLVDSEKLAGGELSEAEKMQRERDRIGGRKGVVSYQWSADGSALLVPVDDALYLARPDGSAVRVARGGQLNPAVSPKGGSISFVRHRRLWVGPVGGEARPVTPAETGETVHWGEAEFVAQEEMDRKVGYWWSPDEARIAIARFDEAGVDIVNRAAIGADKTTIYAQRYPAAGRNNVAIDLYLIDPDGGNAVRADLGAERDIYLARVDWAPDSRTVYVQRIDRRQSRIDMLAVDPATGASRLLFTEKAARGHWINLTDNYRFLDDGSLLWWSERDGHGHLYHYAGGKFRQLTKGPWEVTGLVGVDQQRGRVYFTGNRDDVLENHVHALDLKAPGQIERLTERGFWNEARMDKAGRLLTVTRSSPRQPPQTYLADGNGRRIAWVEENALGADHPYAPYLASHALPSFGTIAAADGSALHWRMLTPKLEPGKRYPVFFEHYGGPHNQSVTRSWTPPRTQAIVDRGFIHFQLDNRGSAHRGVAFEKQIREAMGGVEVADQIAGAAYLKTLPFVDPDRIATYGWSYGGYLTLKMLEAAPGVFAAGIAAAPVSRWELYDTFYTERYMGDPRLVPHAYRKAGTLEELHKIADPLLLIHGMADDNVIFANSTEIAARLQAATAPFEMMFYPGMTHAFATPEANVHVWETIMAFLARRGIGGS